MSGIYTFDFILTTGIIIPIILSSPPDFEIENPLPENFTESHPSLELIHSEFYVLNRTYEKEAEGDRLKLKIPKVFTHLIYECNSTLPTRWHFVGRTRDAHVKNVYVNKYRLYKEKYQFRSTLYIEFRNPESVQNVTCQNECMDELRNTTDCQLLSMSAVINDIDIDNKGYFNFDQEAFIYMRFVNSNDRGNGQRIINQSGDAINSHKLGNSPGCNFSLDVDLNEGKYKCSKRMGAGKRKVEIPTIFLPCRNLDECNIFYQKEIKPNCPDTTTLFQKRCDEEGCYKLKPVTSPFILSCGEDNSFSLARNFFPVTLELLNSSNSMDQNFTIEEFPDKINDFSELYSDFNVLIVTINTTKDLYVGESRTFQCTGLKSFFTYGIQWFLVFDNDTETETNLGLGYENLDLGDVNSDSYTIVSTLNVTFNTSTVTNVKCKASWWNSFKWAEVNISINIIDVEKPSLNLGPVCQKSNNCSCEIVDRRMRFVCPKIGLPPPDITWIIDEVVIDRSTDQMLNWYKILDNNTHSELQLDEKNVLNETQVRYDKLQKIQCNAGNKMGTECHIFQIKENGINIGAIVGIPITILAIITGFGLLWRENRITKKQLRNLTKSEVDEFEYGNPEALALMKKSSEHSSEISPENIHLLPFKRNYIINPADLVVDTTSVLGQGMYGLVLRGNLLGDTVAVKTTQPDADVMYFKALLSEVKVMTYIGDHENVVTFLGAVTKNIQQRIVYVAIEFSPYGDLGSFLKSHRKTFINLYESQNGNESSVQIEGSFISNIKRVTTLDMLNWSKQIAAGMGYLANKKVVHADLATRNVLLFHGHVAKITDFGLSRQLYEHANYVKQQQAPLPWRWMAIESLRDLEFSTASDVWSYGVTVWEIFSLAETPFPGQSWNFDFMDKLKEGLRMSKPKYSSADIYDEVMLNCWNPEPQRRPSFEEIQDLFYKKIEELKRGNQGCEESNSAVIKDDVGAGGNDEGSKASSSVNYMTLNAKDDEKKN